MNRAGKLVAAAIANEAKPPYPAFQNAEIALLEAVLRLTWGEAKSRAGVQRHDVDFWSADEEDISYALAETLDLLIAGGASELMPFLTVFNFQAPEAKLRNHDRSSTKKMCDFSFSRRHAGPGTLRHHNAFFVEAKMITNSHPMSYYSKSGIKRFYEGQYAFCMPHAMLLGYKRDTTQALPDALMQHFGRSGGKNGVAMGLLEDVKAFSLSRFANRMHSSRHLRPGVHRDGVTPLGEITLFHLWLLVD